MYFYLTGIDYKAAPIDIRDKIYRLRKSISDFWMSTDPDGSVLFVTCNRIEIYGSAKYADDAFGHIYRFAERFPDFAEYAYIKYGEAQVFRHALRLATGLESQLQGEEQILIQLASLKHTVVALPLKEMWARAIYLSQKIRSASRLDKNSTDLAALVFEDIRKRLEPKKAYEAVVVGTGSVAGLFAKHCPSEAYIRFAAHKHYTKAMELAERARGSTLHLEDLPGALTEADVLICATSSPHYVISKNHLNEFVSSRNHPLYIYDLSIPRGVAPEIASVDGIFLQNMGDLENIFNRYNLSMRECVESASGMIEDVLRAGGEITNDKHL